MLTASGFLEQGASKHDCEYSRIDSHWSDCLVVLAEQDLMDWLKTIHVSFVVLSISGFFIRGFAMLQNHTWYKTRVIRTASAIIDTILLISALFLASRINQWPFVDGWLTAKVVALLAYIGLGMVALHYGKTGRIRFLAWLGAMLMATYIVLVALYRTTQPWRVFLA